MFFWNSLAFSKIQQMLAIWSLVPLPFFKSSLNIWKFMVHILLKPGLKNFEHYFTSAWDECNLDSLLKSRDIILPTKVHLVKGMIFPVVMYGCESWTIKKSKHQRIDAFELWCWRRLLRVPWTARRSNQSILKESSPEYSLKGWIWSWNSNTLATWCEELTH